MAVQTPSPPRAAGESYLLLLKAMHTHLKPRTYLEIGSATGRSLALAECASLAIDPAFSLTRDPVLKKPSLHLFQCTSDVFFRNNDPSKVLGGPVDMAFLDGMHLYEFLLRDFLNTEKYCRPNSVIALHDCVPADNLMTRRVQFDPAKTLPPAWTGDVWKVAPILKQYRPDLAITVADAAPTGLVLITNLDPSSTVLERAYAEILKAWADVDLASYGLDRFVEECEMVPTSRLKHFDTLAKRFWL